MVYAGAAMCGCVAGKGYSAALTTKPGFDEKSIRGGAKMSTHHVEPWPTSWVVWITRARMTRMEGLS
jgi:hypothetical protein